MTRAVSPCRVPVRQTAETLSTDDNLLSLGAEFGPLNRTFEKETEMKSSYKALFLGLCLASGAVVAPAIAMAGVVIDIDVAPPPVRVETAPGPRSGYVWVPSYWDWRGREHVWVQGRWLR